MARKGDGIGMEALLYADAQEYKFLRCRPFSSFTIKQHEHDYYQHYSTTQLIYHRFPNGTSLLHAAVLAANAGHGVECLEILLSKGVRVSCVFDRDGFTPFHTACHAGDSGVAAMECIYEHCLRVGAQNVEEASFGDSDSNHLEGNALTQLLLKQTTIPPAGSEAERKTALDLAVDGGGVHCSDRAIRWLYSKGFRCSSSVDTAALETAMSRLSLSSRVGARLPVIPRPPAMNAQMSALKLKRKQCCVLLRQSLQRVLVSMREVASHSKTQYSIEPPGRSVVSRAPITFLSRSQMRSLVLAGEIVKTTRVSSVIHTRGVVQKVEELFPDIHTPNQQRVSTTREIAFLSSPTPALDVPTAHLHTRTMLRCLRAGPGMGRESNRILRSDTKWSAAVSAPFVRAITERDVNELQMTFGCIVPTTV